jgi:hypothetical protein
MLPNDEIADVDNAGGAASREVIRGASAERSGASCPGSGSPPLLDV